jgi:hypothetical protein
MAVKTAGGMIMTSELKKEMFERLQNVAEEY